MVPAAVLVKEISLRKQTGVHLSRNGTHVRQWLTYRLQIPRGWKMRWAWVTMISHHLPQYPAHNKCSINIVKIEVKSNSET